MVASGSAACWQSPLELSPRPVALVHSVIKSNPQKCPPGRYAGPVAVQHHGVPNINADTNGVMISL